MGVVEYTVGPTPALPHTETSLLGTLQLLQAQAGVSLCPGPTDA